MFRKTINLVLIILYGFLAPIILVSCSEGDRRSLSKPNVILVITDDQGYGDLSCHGHPYLKTPNLDLLYNESVRFTNFHVDPLCSPTRAALSTGKHHLRSGVWNSHGRTMLNSSAKTMADIFSENGYKTGLFGKWHNGITHPYRPQDRGYQEVLTFLGGGVGQNPDYWRNDYFNDIYIHNGLNQFYEGYCTDIWFESAMKFISEKRDEPFFCHIATNAPHFWYFVPDEYTSLYRNMGMDDFMSRYLGMIANIDENMGKLMAFLEENSLVENTIFIFMTDNGKSGWNLPKEGPFYYNAGMRGWKGSAYDGGHRVPFFIRWPAGLIEGGKDVGQLAAHIDVLPTLIDLCDLEMVEEIDFDGRSIRALMTDNSAAWQDRILFVQSQVFTKPKKWMRCAVMNQQYRLINGEELYDIQQDPGQRNNIFDSSPEVVKELSNAYIEWWEGISGHIDSYNRLAIGHDEENPTRLTANEMVSERPIMNWEQEIIRRREHDNGIWMVEIAESGTYEFICRTYPLEEDTRLNVNGVKLIIGEKVVTKECFPGASQVNLTLDLEKGKSQLQGWFYEAEGDSIGVPYLYIERF